MSPSSTSRAGGADFTWMPSWFGVIKSNRGLLQGGRNPVRQPAHRLPAHDDRRAVRGIRLADAAPGEQRGVSYALAPSFALLLLAGAVPLILFCIASNHGAQLPTTTFFLWERVLREQPLGTRLGWLLRKNLLLILQLLAATALIAALADPWMRYLARPRATWSSSSI